jgi:AcrR family transcriptional regulator
VPTGGDGQSPTRADLGPLPSGHHGLSPQEVAESQRERLLAAVSELTAEHGYGQTAIAEIAKRATVANRVFYANFKSKEDAFIDAFDAVADHLSRLIAEAAEPLEDWSQRIVAGLSVTVAFFASEPVLARFCLVAPFTATSRIAAHCRDRISIALPYLAAGRPQRPEGGDLPASTEDSLVGGVVSQLSRSVLGDADLTAQLPDLVEFVLGPYLGLDDARRLASAL